MPGIVCGLLDPSPADADPVPSGRARDLTVSWLRWGYFGDILADSSTDALLARAVDGGYDYCLVQGWGHILTEDSSPSGGRSISFFRALSDWMERTRFCMAGVPGRCLLVDLTTWQKLGRPSATTFPVIRFGPELSGYLVDLKSDLREGGPFLQGLDAQCEKASRGVFVLNYESYRDVEEVPPGFQPPLSVLYSVAAGLKPNRILQTHTFDAHTLVVFFDYSQQGLAFRRLLREEWDGLDYPRFLRSVFARMPGAGTHYYLWPGASPEDLDWGEMERLWAAELARWGGEQSFADHWKRYRELRHEYLLCNILSHPDVLFDALEDRPGSVIWWSNAFCTVYSATLYSLEQKREIYERWARGLAAKTPRLFLYGSDHSNSSVNCITAGEYWQRYAAQGGDPLLARRFHRHEIRF
ncbi:MAG: hypothetical protein QOK07_747 [Gemmatimonadaceae bacterium]|jgi:hypothetical protein|nr:hypothetical protein [Gemmatimonadaceae bacterium]